MVAFPLVLVEWEDSSQPTSRWYQIAEIVEGAPTVCRTVGFLMRDDARVKVIAHTVNGEGQANHTTGIIRIPSRAVIRIDHLQVVTARLPSARKLRAPSTTVS